MGTFSFVCARGEVTLGDDGMVACPRGQAIDERQWGADFPVRAGRKIRSPVGAGLRYFFLAWPADCLAAVA